MSYLALARKWRPRQFADVMGQEPVVRALSHALSQDRLHPAILLTGTRGVGKTTLARILAKGLNCESGVTATPCGVCGSCREIDEGRSVDMLEIDAASHTGVDNIREIIENSQYAPARSRYKVYLVDEVHMLSKGAFNALLKTLEEPPPHVKFVLATTDPQKLPVTVLSRCLQFGLRRLPVAVIREQLARICEAEQVQAEASALLAVAKAADGSMRDALSLLDQVIAFAGGEPLNGEAVERLLGQSGRAALVPLLAAVCADERPGVAELLTALQAQAPDYADLLDELTALLQRLAMVQALPALRHEEDDPALMALIPQVDPALLQLHYQIAVGARRDLPAVPDPRIAFEMAILRMLAFQPESAATGEGTGDGGRRVAPAGAGGAASATASPAETRRFSPEDWPGTVEALRLEPFAKGLARHAELEADEGHCIRLRLDPKALSLLTPAHRAAIAEALSALKGAPVTLEIAVASATLADTPAERAARAEAQAQAQRLASLEQDPAFRAWQRLFEARLRPGSLQPPLH